MEIREALDKLGVRYTELNDAGVAILAEVTKAKDEELVAVVEANVDAFTRESEVNLPAMLVKNLANRLADCGGEVIIDIGGVRNMKIVVKVERVAEDDIRKTVEFKSYDLVSADTSSTLAEWQDLDRPYAASMLMKFILSNLKGRKLGITFQHSVEV